MHGTQEAPKSPHIPMQRYFQIHLTFQLDKFVKTCLFGKKREFQWLLLLGYRYLPLYQNMDNLKFPGNSKTYGNHTPVTHVLICLLNLKDAQFKRILGRIAF